MTDAVTAPAAEGVRVPYDALPETLRAWVEEALGGAVTSAVTQPGGFSPGAAARLRTSDGRAAFLKAVSSEPNATSPDMHRREGRTTAALPDSAPVPRLLAAYDDGTWVALLLEDVEGRHPHLPWRQDELTAVVRTLDELADDLTPCPVPDAATVGDAWDGEFRHWRSSAVGGPPPGLDAWAARHLDRLAALEATFADAVQGDTLLHLDLRADNLLVTADRVWVVDWPWAARGNPAFDLLGFAPSVAMQGGPDPETLLAMSRHGRAADPDAVTALVAALAGFFHVQSLLPAPPGLPTVRAFQAAQGEVALHWLAERTRWSPRPASLDG